MNSLLLGHIIAMRYVFLARISASDCSLAYDIKEVHDIVVIGSVPLCVRCQALLTELSFLSQLRGILRVFFSDCKYVTLQTLAYEFLKYISSTITT